MSTPSAPSTTDRLRVDLVTLDREVFSAMCDEVTLPGQLGYFGVLPGHAALVATLAIGVLTVRYGAKSRKLALSGGFCEVRDNVVTVLADDAETPDQIDVAATTAALAEAEKQVNAAQDESYVGFMRTIELARARLAVVARD